MKFATTATVIAAALAMFNPAEAKLRGSRMDMDDNVGGFAGAMTSPAAFRIANWGQRVGPFVGPMKSAMGFDVDDELGQGRCQVPRGCRLVKTCTEYQAKCRHVMCKSPPPGRRWYARGCGPVTINAGQFERPEYHKYLIKNELKGGRRDMDDEVGAWGLAGKLIMHELSGGRPAYDEDDELGRRRRFKSIKRL